MMKKALLSSLVALAAVGGEPSEAHAAPTYVDGPMQFNYGICPWANTVVQTSATWVSYFGDPSTSFPGTGDTAYVRAIVWNTSGCTNDTYGFFFTLPEGARLAVSQTNPVICYRGWSGTNYENVPNASNSACLQTPQVDAKGLFFGYTQLPPAWFFEVRIPVTYVKAAGSLDEKDKLHVQTASSWGPMFPKQSVPIYFNPKIENHSVIANNSFDATLGFDVTHYYELGWVDIEYSTDPTFAYGPQTVVQRTPSVETNPNWFSHPGTTVQLSGLSPGVTYYWRVRMFSYLRGGKVGPIQSFTTPYATLIRPPTYCRWYGC